MVGQILPNNNENCYNNFSPKFSPLNTALVAQTWQRQRILPRHQFAAPMEPDHPVAISLHHCHEPMTLLSAHQSQ
jgi:hypothetical protein